MANELSFKRDNELHKYDEHMRFICPECGEESDSQHSWRKHLNVQHSYATKTLKDLDFKEIDDKFHECQVCLKWVANAQQNIALVQYHRFLHLPFPRTYQCRHCTVAFTRKKALCEHLSRFHEDIMEEKVSKRRLQELIKSYEISSPQHNVDFYIKYLCPLCGKKFDSCNYWQQHVDAAHSATSVDLRMFRIQSTKNYYCAQCCKTLYDSPTKSELQRHNFTHQPYPLYFKCTYCSVRKSYKTELLIHFIKTHQEVYEKYKDYIKKPTEWGGQADEKVLRELDTLLVANKANQTDILQKAIQNSLLDLEEDVDKESVFHHETVLDKSLQELDEILNSEIDPNLHIKVKKEYSTEHDLDDEELEELCSEMFEEITEQYEDEELKSPNKKRLRLDLSSVENVPKIKDSMQKEMHKYINYICPECGDEFLSQSLWRTHVFEEHDLANAVETKFRPYNSQRTEFVCLVCYQVQSTTKHTELRRHHFQHMPYQAYLKCAICSKTKSSKPKILQHLQFSHLNEIQKSTSQTASKTATKSFRCWDCDKLYVQQTRYEAHCRECPQRLKPLAVGLFDIDKNMKLLEHLKNASERIGKLLAEEDV